MKITDKSTYCSNCEQDVEVEIYETPESVHYGKATCPICRRFLTWVKKPDNNQKRPNNKYLPKKLCINYCQICGRTEANLYPKEVFISHHLIPISEGGVESQKTSLLYVRLAIASCIGAEEIYQSIGD